MTKAQCPSCDSFIPSPRKPKIGAQVVCPVCKEKLEIVWLRPVEFDWLVDDEEYNDYGAYDEYDEIEYMGDNNRK